MDRREVPRADRQVVRRVVEAGPLWAHQEPRGDSRRVVVEDDAVAVVAAIWKKSKRISNRFHWNRSGCSQALPLVGRPGLVVWGRRAALPIRVGEWGCRECLVVVARGCRAVLRPRMIPM